jgi:hypothetical protein
LKSADKLVKCIIAVSTQNNLQQTGHDLHPDFTPDESRVGRECGDARWTVHFQFRLAAQHIIFEK